MHRITLQEIESILSERDLRLRKAVWMRGRYHVEVQDVVTKIIFEARGIELRDAVENAVAAARRRPPRRTRRRYSS